jgi:N6-adenosine-specific RNA methylase IME4
MERSEAPVTDTPEGTTTTDKGDVTRRRLPISGLRLEVVKRVRRNVNRDVVERYAEARREGATFPPIVVFHESETDTYWVADGLHRVESAKEAGQTEVDVEIRPGTERDALLSAVSANLKHGLPMTKEDQKHTATILLNDPEWREWGDREIGRHCGLDGKTVAELRRGLSAEFPQMRKFTRKGKTHRMKTTRIGGKPEQENPTVAQPGAHRQPPQPTEVVGGNPTTETVPANLIPEPTPTTEACPPSSDDAPAEPTNVVETQEQMEPTALPEQFRDTFVGVVVNPPWASPREVLQGLPVGELAAPDAVLFLWTPRKSLPEALALARSWGFEYRDVLTWVRGARGDQQRMTAKTAHCIVGVRGQVNLTLGWHGLWHCGATTLRQLPLFYELVEKSCPGPKVHLFAGEHREGWTCLGRDAVGRSWQELTPAEHPQTPPS